jgi:competence protein ComEC
MQLFQCSTEKVNKSHPLLLPLFSFIIGIFWQQFYQYNSIITSISVVLIFVLLIILVIKNFNLELIQLFSYFLFFFCGAFLLQYQKNHHQQLLKKIENKKLDVLALIKDKEKIIDKKFKEIITLEVRAIKKSAPDSKHQKTNFNLLCYTSTTTSAKIGDTVAIKNLSLTIPKKDPTNFKFVTFDDYLIKENILATVFTYKLNYKPTSSPNFSLGRWLLNKRNYIFQKIKQKMSSQTFCYFSSIFLGNKKNYNMNDLRETFNYWGISHHLARAGLHISLFILIWKFFLNLLPLTIYLKQILLLLICLIYQQLSWTSIPFVRAFYIFVFYEVGKLLNQQTNFLHLLTFLCLILLLFNPIQLLFLDFQLSFALTFALGWLGYINRAQNADSILKKNRVR